VLVWWIVASRDAAPPDDGDLVIALAAPPDGDNAVAIIAASAGVLRGDTAAAGYPDALVRDWVGLIHDGLDVRPREATARRRRRARALPPPTRWDTDAARALVAANAAALAQLRAAAAASHAEPARFTVDSAYPMAQSRNLTNLAIVAAEVRRRDGDFAGAVDTLEPLLQLGRLLARGDGGVTQLYLGVALQQRALTSLRVVTGDPACPAEQCERAAGLAAVLSAVPPGIERALRFHYTAVSEEITALAERRSDLQLPKIAGDGGAGWLLHPNRTRAILAKDCRELVTALERHPTERFLLTAEKEVAAMDDGWERARLLAVGNWLGHWLRKTTLPSSYGLRTTTADRRCALRMTQAWCALLAHRRRAGSWPATLVAVVPDLGPDPWDPQGGALRWDPKRRRLWSVGRHGTDAGGTTHEYWLASSRQLQWGPHDVVLQLPDQ
jgi:hypothetical protein